MTNGHLSGNYTVEKNRFKSRNRHLIAQIIHIFTTRIISLVPSLPTVALKRARN